MKDQKHITYIANVRIPTERAHGIQIMNTCASLVNTGVDVKLYIPRRFNVIKEDPFKFYGLQTRFSIVKIPVIDTVQFGKIGFLFEAVLFSLGTFLATLFSKRTIFSRDEMTLVLPIIFGKKVIWETHTGAWNYFARFVARRAYGVIVISKGLKDFYIEKGIDQERISIIPDAVNVEGFMVSETQEQSREKCNLPQDKKIALINSSLYEWKGIYTMADAAQYFDNETLFVFVGGGDTDDVFKNKYKDQKNMLFTGHVSHESIPYYLKSADVLVLPNSGKTQVSREFTSPMKLFEYMASGVPIVASNLPSITEVLNDSNASLFEADNPEALANVIKKTLDSDSRESVQNKARQSLIDVQEYTWEKRAGQIIDLL